MTTRPPVRVVLVNYRCADDIEARLRSGVFGPSDEVLIVDNGSDPERVSAWESQYGVSAVLLGTNAGFAAAVNVAVAASRTAAPILLLNPDLELTGPVLNALVAALGNGNGDGNGDGNRDGDVDGVAPLLLDQGNRVQVGAAGGPLTLGAVAAYFLMVSHLLPRLRGVFLTRRQLASGTPTAWLCMACLLVRADAFERFGPIPEDELVYGEDLAWGTAASAAGARFVLQPGLTAVHVQGASGGSARWVGAFERTLRRRLPRTQGTLAVACVRIGVGARRIVGRRVA
jgi:N-acetylglucosaminyl-diphospho-decaprenol L-rhamnosyltransferase